MFERLRAAINAAIQSATPSPDARDRDALMQQAAVEVRVAVDQLRRAFSATELELRAERQHLADAERRGTLAAEIKDQETVDVAARFVAKHNERITILEQKLAAQRAELSLAEREMGEMTEQLKTLKQGTKGPASSRIEAAWNELRAAGGSRPGFDLDSEADLFQTQLDRSKLEATAEEQLQALKKKMGK